MSNKVFHAGRTAAQYRESSQKYWNIVQSKKADERRALRKLENNKKYGSVVEILTKEILRRPNIALTYRNLLPIIEELINDSKYLSSRFSEKDVETITVMVVKQAHMLAKHKEDKEIEEKQM